MLSLLHQANNKQTTIFIQHITESDSRAFQLHGREEKKISDRPTEYVSRNQQEKQCRLAELSEWLSFEFLLLLSYIQKSALCCVCLCSVWCSLQLFNVLLMYEYFIYQRWWRRRILLVVDSNQSKFNMRFDFERLETWKMFERENLKFQDCQMKIVKLRENLSFSPTHETHRTSCCDPHKLGTSSTQVWEARKFRERTERIGKILLRAVEKGKFSVEIFRRFSHENQDFFFPISIARWSLCEPKKKFHHSSKTQKKIFQFQVDNRTENWKRGNDNQLGKKKQYKKILSIAFFSDW